MRIVHVVPTYLPAVRYGGPIFAVHGLCRALAERGHDVEVFTTSIDGARDSDVPIGVPVPLDGVTVRYFEANFRRLSWAPALKAALQVRVAGADLVHLHSVFLWPTWAGARTARDRAIPYVLSPRGMLVPELIERRQTFLKSAWIGLIERANVENAAALHLTSFIEAEQLSAFRFRLPPLEIIPNGIDDAESSGGGGRIGDDLLSLKAARPLVLYFGRLSWKKGIERLLDAFALCQTGTLAIVGTDDENLAPRLWQRALGLGLEGRIQIVPRTVVGAEKHYVFSHAAVFALTSDSENFGNTVVEAMHHGVPTLVTSGVGAGDIVRASESGFVVDQDREAIARAIEQLLANPNLARERGERGRVYVEQNLTWPAIAARMEAFYGRLKSTASLSAVA